MLSSHLPWMLYILRHLLTSLPSSCWLSFQKHLLKIYVSGIKGLRCRVCSLSSRSCRLVGMTGKQRQKFQDKSVCVVFRNTRRGIRLRLQCNGGWTCKTCRGGRAWTEWGRVSGEWLDEMKWRAGRCRQRNSIWEGEEHAGTRDVAKNFALLVACACVRCGWEEIREAGPWKKQGWRNRVRSLCNFQEIALSLNVWGRTREGI